MLTTEELANLPDTEKGRYAALEAVFGNPGWEFIKEWANNNAELAKQRALTAPNWDSHVMARSQLMVYTLVSKLEDTVNAEYSQLAEQEAAQKALTLDDALDAE